MLCSLRLSALPKKLYEAQVNGPEDGEVLLGTWVDLRGEPAAASHYCIRLLLYIGIKICCRWNMCSAQTAANAEGCVTHRVMLGKAS